MFPTLDFFGMKLDSYTVMLSVGVVICMIFIRLLADRRKMRGKLQNLILFNAKSFSIIKGKVDVPLSNNASMVRIYLIYVFSNYSYAGSPFQVTG